MIKKYFVFIILFLQSLVIFAQDEEIVENPPQDTGMWIFIGILMTILMLTVTVLYIMGFVLWIRAKLSHVKIALFHILIMKYKHVPAEKIVHSMIMAKEGGIDIPYNKLVAHYLSGGNVEKTVEALIAAEHADEGLDENSKIHLTFDSAAAIDHAGYDILDVVNSSIKYKVVETGEIQAYAQDGVQLKMKCKVTLRALIHRIIQCAGIDTVIAIVDEGIVTRIGNFESHLQLLKSPFLAAESVLHDKALFKDTAYEVLSVDISDIKVGKNIHVELAIEKAGETKAKAEAKRMESLAKEQEMKAKAEEARVKFIESEIEVQKAMAAAFLDGNLSVHDYHQMKNTEADTTMRESLAKSLHPKH